MYPLARLRHAKKNQGTILTTASRKGDPNVPFPTLAGSFRFVFPQGGDRGADGCDVSGYSADRDPRSGPAELAGSSELTLALVAFGMGDLR